MTLTSLASWHHARVTRQAESYVAEVARLAAKLADRDAVRPASLDELADMAGPFEAFAVAHAEWLAVIWFGSDLDERAAVNRYVARLAQAAGYPHFSGQGWTGYASAPGAQYKADKAVALRCFRKWEQAGWPGLHDGICAAFSHLRAWAIRTESRYDSTVWGVLVGALCDLKSEARSEPILTRAQLHI